MLLFYKLTVCKKNTAARRLCQEGENRKSIHFLRRCIAFARGFWYDTIELKGDFGRMDRWQGFDVGADDYLTKPIKMKLLVSRVQAILKRIDADRPPEKALPMAARPEAT